MSGPAACVLSRVNAQVGMGQPAAGAALDSPGSPATPGLNDFGAIFSFLWPSFSN